MFMNIATEKYYVTFGEKSLLGIRASFLSCSRSFKFLFEVKEMKNFLKFN